MVNTGRLLTIEMYANEFSVNCLTSSLSYLFKTDVTLSKASAFELDGSMTIFFDSYDEL